MTRHLLVNNTVFHVDESPRPDASECSFHSLSAESAIDELRRLTNAGVSWTACDLCLASMRVVIPWLIKRSKIQ